MRFMSRTAVMLLLVVGACLSVGCSEKTTGPDKNPPLSTGEYLWSNRFGDETTQNASEVAVDALGNVIVTGYFVGTVDFGGGTLINSGVMMDIFVAKFGPDGSHIWSKRFGDANIQLANDVAVDASGNIIVAGGFRGTVDFGGGALTSTYLDDIFIAKFGPDGSHLWSKRFGDGNTQVAYAVAADASGNVVVIGSFEGSVNFGGSSFMSDGMNDIFVAKFGPDGSHLWSKRFGNPSDQHGNDIAVDASQNVFVVGYFAGAVDFGGGTLVSEGGNDIFVAKFGSDGAHVWSKRFGDGAGQTAAGVAVDASGNVIAAGYFNGTVDFGGGTFTSAGNNDIFIAQFGSGGTHLWSKRFGDGSQQYCASVTVDASGNVIAAGHYEGTVEFGGDALTSAGIMDIFIAKFGSDGAHIWSKRFGDMVSQLARGVTVDVSENVVVTGEFRGTVDFGGGALTSAGDNDIYVAKFGP